MCRRQSPVLEVVLGHAHHDPHLATSLESHWGWTWILDAGNDQAGKSDSVALVLMTTAFRHFGRRSRHIHAPSRSIAILGWRYFLSLGDRESLHFGYGGLMSSARSILFDYFACMIPNSALGGPHLSSLAHIVIQAVNSQIYCT